MRLISIFLVLFTLSACSETVKVPEDKFGILFRLGEIKTSVSGPATLEINFLNTVHLVNKEDKIELGNGKFIIRYRIADPIKYYLTTGDNKPNLVKIIEKKLVNYALKGEPVNTKEHLYKMIEDMGLPIILE